MNTLTVIKIVINKIQDELERIARRNYHGRHQYPQIFFEIEAALDGIRAWLNDYEAFCGVPMFSDLPSATLKNLGDMIVELITLCTPEDGKKRVSKKTIMKERKRLQEVMGNMISKLVKNLDKIKSNDTVIEDETEKAIIKAFEEHMKKDHTQEDRRHLSGRGGKTVVFPWSDQLGYGDLIENTKRFKAEILRVLIEKKSFRGHKKTCRNSDHYHLCGKRTADRKVVMKSGEKRSFNIRIVQCADCGQKFSLLPSFLPREKNFELALIGDVIRSVVHFYQSLNGALLYSDSVKSKQTILNWIRWFGAIHPAVLLTKAGITGSGYLQEDEGFEKESGMRTYTIAMVEPETLLVWHLDYVDHVDKETMVHSFKDFLSKIDFKVIGVTKDKLESATNALYEVFHKLWIGFCHRHCLEKFRKALEAYRKETECSYKKTEELYKQFKKVLDTATSEANLRAKVSFLKDEAFDHPELRKVLDHVVADGARYTCHKKRNGIKKTTSLVDNFLKKVKQKLRQVESFRNKKCTMSLFCAMANLRNFVPFMSGAKNANKSPFMLAGGETFDLPWAEVMNVNDAFLFEGIK